MQGEVFEGHAADESVPDLFPAFEGVAYLSLMNMTIEFIAQHPSEADRFWDAGFTAFWNAVTGS